MNSSKKIIRKLLFRTIILLGIPKLIREFIQRRSVTILLFHSISPESALRIFSFLSKNYNLIDLADYNEALRLKRTDFLPAKSLVITFDDGLKENYLLLPVIKRYHIPVTIFLTTEIIGTSRHFWDTIKHPEFSLAQLKNMSNEQRLIALSKVGFNQYAQEQTRQSLSFEEIHEMMPFVNFQSHGRFHAPLPLCGAQEAQLEIEYSKRQLEELLKKPVYAIAYPYGYYSERDLEFSRKIGYSCGLTVDFGLNNSKTDPFRIKRLNVNDAEDLDEFIIKACGITDFFRNLFKKHKTGQFPDLQENQLERPHPGFKDDLLDKQIAG